MHPYRIILLGLIALLAPAARGADHPAATSRLALRERPDGRVSLAWSTRDSTLALPATLPPAVGVTLHLRAAASGDEATFILPGSLWTLNRAGTVLTFRNAQAPLGPTPVRVVRLAVGRGIKVSARTTGLTLGEPAQGSVDVRLMIGTDVFCGACSAPQRDGPGAYSAQKCAAPATCGEGFCGDAVVNASGEQCDFFDFSACAFPLFPFGATRACESPGGTRECRCCNIDSCVFGFDPCCGTSRCVDTIGMGTFRGGTCVPETCADAADCHSNYFDCVDGECCALEGNPCPGGVPCCPGTGAVCTPFAGGAVFRCCRPAGTACTTSGSCCSGSCNGGTSTCD